MMRPSLSDVGAELGSRQLALLHHCSSMHPQRKLSNTYTICALEDCLAMCASCNSVCDSEVDLVLDYIPQQSK